MKAFFARLFGKAASVVIPFILSFITDIIVRLYAEYERRRARAKQRKVDEANAKKYKEAVTDEEKAKTGTDLLNGDDSGK